MRVRLVVALLLVLVALGAFNYLRPIPAISPAHLLRTSDVVPGAPPGLPWPSRGSAAVGVSGLGLLASSGNAQTFPAASVTKVMTALVILADKPLKSNEGGPTVTLTGADVQSYQADLAGGQSVAKVEVGEQLSELQLVQGMLIPSANNYAESAARWDAGSLGAFIARMNDRAAKLKLAHTKFADVSGASPASVSTPADLLALGMEAMRDPVFAEIVAGNEAVATYTTPWGAQSDLVSADDVDVVEWPGMVVRQRLDAKSIVIDKPLPSSTPEGTEHVVLGDYDLDVPLVTADPLYPPGRLWRLTRVTL